MEVFEIKNINNREAADLHIGIKEFAETLAGEDDTIHLRIFDDKKRGIFKGAKKSVKVNELADIDEELKKHNMQERGIFMVVNSGGQTDAEINRINAHFIEMDEGSFEEQYNKIKSFPVMPSMVIMTKKSLHTYWLMKDGAETSRFSDVQKALIKHFGGDPAIKNLSRVMRVPGFDHCKTDTPVKVICVWYHPELRYTQDELIKNLPEYEDSKSKPVSETPLGLTESLWGTQEGIENVMHCRFIEYCRDNAKTLSEPLWTAMISNLASLRGGEKLVHELSEPYPHYSFEETQEKIERVKSESIKPYHCATIAGLGYDCPKLKDGGCKCKSPIALCYQPLSAEALADILRATPVCDDELKDTATACKFIEKYLRGVSSAIARVFITGNIMRHFHLSAKTASQLWEDEKKYRRGNKTKKEQDILPPWYEDTDGVPVFMPGILARSLAETEKIIYSTGEYYMYHGGVYQSAVRERILALIKSKMLEKYTKANQIKDAELQYKIDIVREPSELNSDPCMINLRNGLYDIRTGELTDHDPEFLSTIQLPVRYDESADCPLFRQYLADVMEGTEDQIPLIQEMLGYLLVPVTRAQTSFIVVGAGGAGKSVLLRVINELLLGTGNVSNVPWQALNERFKLAEIFGKLANIFADLPSQAICDNGIFKALVGEDTLIAERKNRDPFSFRPTARMVFSCNEIPKNLGDRSEGFYRKLTIIRFNHPIPDEKKDGQLFEKLAQEADGIFMFALEGLRRLMANNYRFSTTETNTAELERYKTESNSVLAFVKDECETSPKYAVGSTELYSRYKAYCEETGCKPFSQRTFVNQLIGARPDVSRGTDKTGKRRVLIGIRLTDSIL